ncbi:MAG: AraC family transcriptional regulator [Phycisphaerales bacterium]|nr:AraC family transcriptional regulator [Phycisphaerales bacterium]
MQSTQLRADALNAVQHLLGENVLVVANEKRILNKSISIQSSTVNFPEERLPGQFGQIICPKTENAQQSIQLLYLKHHLTAHSTAVVVSVFFEPDFLNQWDDFDILSEEVFSENNAGLQINYCKETASFIHELLNNPAQSEFAEKLQHIALSLQLLRKAISQIGSINDTYSVPACSFLSNNKEREKVLQTRDILEKEYDQVLSIKELSRRVAINECYLKKGFKTMFGKTINEYQQHLRISKAKELLQTEGYTVSEVALSLGYSSISHFSTAFKKATNMKPCELLK